VLGFRDCSGIRPEENAAENFPFPSAPPPFMVAVRPLILLPLGALLDDGLTVSREESD
jgi:hypothetical protein